MLRRLQLRFAIYFCGAMLYIGLCGVASAQSCGASGLHDLTGEHASTGDHVPLVDHHTHVLTPRSAHWIEVQGKSALKPRGIEDLLTAMHDDGVERAAVLSVAYWFGHTTEKTQRNYDDVKTENDNIGRLVANYPKQLVAFFGINPLAPTALQEIRRNIDSGRFVGIKLHLANADVDLRNPSQIKQLASVFALANKLHVPIVVHMRTRRKDYGYVDSANFIKGVLSKAPDITVQIAHLAGWGGYDSNTDGALRAFVDNKEKIRTKLYFDIAAIVSDENTESSDRKATLRWPDTHYKEVLAGRLREIGLQRVVFGTDWPLVAPAKYWHEFSEQIPLEPCELAIIRANRTPWLTDTPKDALVYSRLMHHGGRPLTSSFP